MLFLFPRVQSFKEFSENFSSCNQVRTWIQAFLCFFPKEVQKFCGQYVHICVHSCICKNKISGFLSQVYVWNCYQYSLTLDKDLRGPLDLRILISEAAILSGTLGRAVSSKHWLWHVENLCQAESSPVHSSVLSGCSFHCSVFQEPATNLPGQQQIKSGQPDWSTLSSVPPSSSLLREGRVQNHQDPAWRLTQRQRGGKKNQQGIEVNTFSSLCSLVFSPDLF